MKKNIIIIVLLICIAVLGTIYYDKADDYKYLQSSIDQQFQQQLGLLISTLSNLNNDTIEIEDTEYKQVIYSLTYLSNMTALTTYSQKNKKLEGVINYLYDYVDKDSLVELGLIIDNLELRQSLGHFHMNLASEKEATNLIKLLKEYKKDNH